MLNYLGLMHKVMEEGEDRTDRTGVGTRSLFSTSLSFDLRAGFPAVTTKRLAFGPVKSELVGFLRAHDNAADFRNEGCKIWDANANSEYWQENPNCKGPDDLGRVYGVQWRKWRKYQLFASNVYTGGRYDVKHVDQLRDVTDRIVSNPTDRRLLVTAWNPAELDQMCLPPCHLMYQFYVGFDGGDRRLGPRWLDMKVYMRSVDVFIGMPFDIASYALLLHLVARTVGLEARKLHMDFADTHVYRNHFGQARLQLSRDPMPLPRLDLDTKLTDYDDFVPEQAVLLDYMHHAPIKAPMNV